MSAGSSSGTFANASFTMRAARSSGRTSRSDPLLARPIGDRAVATMTASGMVTPGVISERWPSRDQDPHGLGDAGRLVVSVDLDCVPDHCPHTGRGVRDIDQRG